MTGFTTKPTKPFGKVFLQEVTPANFNECISLKRESSRYVGDAESVLAEAYIYRGDSLAFAICVNDTIVGLVIVRVKPSDGAPYSFTNLIIADNYQHQGYGKRAVEAILNKFRNEKRSCLVRIQVHYSNEYARKIYGQCGFREIGKAEWNSDFLVLELPL